MRVPFSTSRPPALSCSLAWLLLHVAPSIAASLEGGLLHRLTIMDGMAASGLQSGFASAEVDERSQGQY